ncbi:mandelate racemase/muconate lactonizing enzyme family protein [Paenibacillus dendritiformis]|uniref:mandelate racemase/muconate lactonizing enzyme family protein n=1 Tax=Paenibacillus dendritiformis TaxID=130049 RepID=UPI00143DBEEB|nr:mandelate racemase/muconate lactonizing enzyme family protein [Paenibacillus dendritiformis]NKI20676.1 mandelate racemase/muconate lactonizing enzyme family protein [Paenibacillus dendritiformis]NRF96562.1 mandelate racemase/muconate lactonizing enzyme family protein [Paenibacillus dendritiformis]
MSRLLIKEAVFEKVTVGFQGESISSYFLLIKTSEEFQGFFGPVYKPYLSAYMELCRLLLDKDPLRTEAIWKILWDSQLGGRTGLFMEFMSAIDCALWDIKGKYFHAPVYELLGGRTRSSVPCYASMLGFNEAEKGAVSIAKQYYMSGFEFQKWPLRFQYHGNIEEHARNVRELVEGVPDCNFMFDVFGKWNYNQFLAFVKYTKDLKITWIEEPLPSESYINMNLSSSLLPLAFGEHLSHVYEFTPFATNSGVVFLQPDIGRCGGITEAMKILGLAKAFGKRIIPHGHNLLPALHLAASQPSDTLPMVEYHITIEPRRQCFYKNPVIPKGDLLEIGSIIGLGMDYDQDKIERVETICSIS